MLEANTIVNGCYILRRRIGEDSFSEWWQASAIFVASNFLLRFIKPGYASDELRTKAFFELARRRIALVSPAILSLIEVDRFGDRCFIASEYGGHSNLESILDSGKRFSVEHSCRLAIELAEGVGTFHLRGESFGVLAPECVAVHSIGDSMDELKILMPGYEPFFDLVPENMVDDYRHTWGYASPEMKKGMPTDYKSDIYSLGVLLFRLLTGKLPYGSRSGLLVRSRSASPAHIAAALARRGIPRELTTTTVRALRKSNALRHEDIMSFIADLRMILDARRKAFMQAGEPDPIADLATLNLKKAKADAREIVRSLETVNYFRLISENGKLEPVEPIEIVEADAELLELEELEADQDEDDDSIATEDYVSAGYQAALERAKVVVPQTAMLAPSAPVVTAPAQIAAAWPEAAGSEPVSAPSVPPTPASTQPVVQVAASSASRGVAKPRTRPAGLVWRKSEGRASDVADTILEAVERAGSGVGLVRFIEEPAAGEPQTIVAAALDSIRRTSHVVDVGILPEHATIDQVAALIERGTSTVSTPGKSGKRSRTSKAVACVRALMTMARNEKPLVIVAHGSEGISKSAHRLFLELAKQASYAPLCAFLFFKAEGVPSWHVLSALDESP